MNGDDERGDRADREDAERNAMTRALHDYRAAAAALDERPSAAARAAILAAAAREVGARPRDAATGVPPGRGHRALRWPMAAAATVLLSSLAVMMAQRVEQESPTVAEIAVPPATPAAPSTDDRAAAEGPAVAIAPAPPADAVAERPTTAPTLAAPRSPPPPRRARQEPPAPGIAAPEAARERSVVQSAPSSPTPPPAPSAPAPFAAAPSAPAATAAPPIAQPSEQAAAADTATARRQQTAPSAKASSSREARSEAGLGAAQRADAVPAEAEERALSADDWLARIVRLREAGRHAEADAQLQRFRQRYPQVRLPEQALPPAGTR